MEGEEEWGRNERGTREEGKGGEKKKIKVFNKSLRPQ